MKKLAIIGASELQNPLILKAKDLGFETHVFAWAAGDIGEKTADCFYPISIVEKDAILEKCREIGVDGICTIASDLANITVGYVADKMGLPGNSPECIVNSTNKHEMRLCFESHGCPSPISRAVLRGEEPDISGMRFPLIVKPTDRSGSRGITKVETPDKVKEALQAAYDVSFTDVALVEEFAEGREFSVEGCSWNGEHTILAITEKFTTGAPYFIERGHLEPARLTPGLREKVVSVVTDALTALGVKQGASHSELKIDDEGNIRLIEIGSRMGGDCIGSDLVELSTGIDFLAAVINCALGMEPNLKGPEDVRVYESAVVKYIFDQKDVEVLERIYTDHPDWVVRKTEVSKFDHEITDSSTRNGFALLAFDEPFCQEYLGFSS